MQYSEPNKVLIRLPQVQAIVPYSRSSIYALVAAGKFPAPCRLGPRASAWVLAEVEAWAASRIAERADSFFHLFVVVAAVRKFIAIFR